MVWKSATDQRDDSTKYSKSYYIAYGIIVILIYQHIAMNWCSRESVIRSKRLTASIFGKNEVATYIVSILMHKYK